MATRNTLDVLKQCFEEVVPRHDKRTTIAPLSFVVCLVYTYLGDSKTFSLEAIRRGMMHHLKTRISRSAFWERLARHRLQTLLQGVVAQLMGTLTTSALIGEQLLARLGVSRIELVDSSSITLWDGAKQAYPGTRTTAGIKWHLALDVLSGGMTWWRLTPTATHDRKCFPDVASLRGKLVIFDLGYWDYGLLIAIEAAGGFFLSRLKSTAVIRIQAVVQGLSKKYIGQDLLALPLSGHRNRLIEVLIEKGHHGHMLRCRVIGFWNPAEGSYHWYITNLTAAAYLMYPLYRLRWQIELIFKACKNSLNANQITSNDTSIIQSLLLASLVAHLSTATILHGGLAQLDEEQQLAISFQRIAKVAVVLAQDFVHFLLNASRHYFFQLVDQIKLFAPELFDPNYKHRETTLMRLNRRLETGP